MWWYYRDTAAWVTTVHVNTDLTPANERKLVDRVDGPTSYNYDPVTNQPQPVDPASTTSTPSPST